MYKNIVLKTAMFYRKLLEFAQFLLLLNWILGKSIVSDSDRIKRLATPQFNIDVLRNQGKFVVSLRSRTPEYYFGDNHFCGGVLISDIFVLTAAHCVMDSRKIIFSSRVLLVVAGTPNRHAHIFGKTMNVPVKKIFVPANFTIHNTNNLGILKLSRVMPKDNSWIGFCKLPTQAPTPSVKYRVLGWGRLYKGGPMASEILFIDVTLQPREFCKDFIKHLSPEMMCAGNFKNFEENPCTGDSGDPFMLGDTVYGIATYDLGCANTHMPSVYTDVFFHIDWIKHIMKVNGSRSCFNIVCLHFVLSCFWTMFA